MAPAHGKAGAEVREEHADIGMTLIWVRNQPFPINSGLENGLF